MYRAFYLTYLCSSICVFYMPFMFTSGTSILELVLAYNYIIYERLFRRHFRDLSAAIANQNWPAERTGALGDRQRNSRRGSRRSWMRCAARARARRQSCRDHRAVRTGLFSVVRVNIVDFDRGTCQWHFLADVLPAGRHAESTLRERYICIHTSTRYVTVCKNLPLVDRRLSPRSTYHRTHVLTHARTHFPARTRIKREKKRSYTRTHAHTYVLLQPIAGPLVGDSLSTQPSRPIIDRPITRLSARRRRHHHHSSREEELHLLGTNIKRRKCTGYFTRTCIRAERAVRRIGLLFRERSRFIDSARSWARSLRPSPPPPPRGSE